MFSCLAEDQLNGDFCVTLLKLFVKVARRDPQDTFTQRHRDSMPRSFLVKKYFAKQKPNYSELECQNGEFVLFSCFLFLVWVMKASLRKSAIERKPPVFLNALATFPPPLRLFLFNLSDDSFPTLFSKHQSRCTV